MATIYINGNILTMDHKNTQAEALCIDKGIIQAVGSNRQILEFRQEKDTVIDLEGKTMMPGFIDPHSHFTGLANSLSQCDLSRAASFQDIISMMKAFIRENHIKAGEWVFGSGYDPYNLIEKRHPDKFVLDQISQDHPIVAVHVSSHMGAANSMALALQGINRNTEDPEGGKYFRIFDNGELSGVMEENAFIEFQKSCPMISEERLFELMEKAQGIYASYGITTIQEGMVSAPLFALLKEAAKREKLFLDVIGYIDLKENRDLLIKNKEMTENYDHHFKIGGYKIFLDGSPQGRTAWMSRPYEGEESYRGYPAMSDESLHDMILTSCKDSRQLLAHCNGDAAAEQFISQFEKVLNENPEFDSHRPVMIHAQLVREDQLARMKKIGMMPSFFAAHVVHWGDIHIQNFGMDRAEKISPAQDAVKLDIPFTFHQDSPVILPDMMETVDCAVNRITKNGVILGKNERIECIEALKAITINGAYQYFEEDRKGSIEKGKFADLVVLDRNPLLTDKNELKKISVLETIKEGKTVYKRTAE